MCWHRRNYWLYQYFFIPFCEKPNCSSIHFTRGIVPAQARSCGQSSCFISIFVRVIVAVIFMFWVDHCFSSFFIVIWLELWWWNVYALFSTHERLNCVSNVIDIVCGVVWCVTETYCLFVFLICYLYCWDYINYIKVVESTFCFWIFFLQFSCVY